jgi:hypothetical protein
MTHQGFFSSDNAQEEQEEMFFLEKMFRSLPSSSDEMTEVP